MSQVDMATVARIFETTGQEIIHWSGSTDAYA